MVFLIASIFVTWQLHVHIIKVIFVSCKKITVSAKMTGLGTKLHVEFKTNSCDNTCWVLLGVASNFLQTYQTMPRLSYNLITDNLFNNLY